MAHELDGVARGVHPLAPASARRFDHHRKADARGLRVQTVVGLILPVVAWNHGHAEAVHLLARRILVAHEPVDVARRTDEDDRGVAAGVGEIPVLAQETVARMNGGSARSFCGFENPIDIQIGLRRGGGADGNRSIRFPHVKGARVRF